MKRWNLSLSLSLSLVLFAGSASAGLIQTVAGGGSNAPAVGLPATSAALDSYAHRVGPDGYLYITEDGYREILPNRGFMRVNGSGLIDRLVMLDPMFFSSWNDDLVVDRDGNVFMVEYFGCRVAKIAPDGTLSFYGNGTCGWAGDGLLATDPGVQFDVPESLAIDPAGNLYIGMRGGIRRVDTQGIVGTVLYDANMSHPVSLWVDGAENIFFVYNDAVNGDALKRVTTSLLGPVTIYVTTERYMNGLTGDRWGNIYVAEVGIDYTSYLKRIDAAGNSSTVESSVLCDNFSRLSTDRDGFVYMSCFDPGGADKVLRAVFPPVLTAVTDSTGGDGSKQAALAGRYFVSNGIGGGVTIGGIAAPIVDWQNEALVVTIPAGLNPNKSYNVQVTTKDGQVSNILKYTIPR